jgi:hypothetical protein
MYRRVDVRPAVFGGRKIVGGIVETRRCHAIVHDRHLESLGRRPEHRVVAVRMRQIDDGALHGRGRWCGTGGNEE